MREVAPSFGAAGTGTAVGVAKSPEGVVPERASASDHGNTPSRPIIFRAEGVEIDPQLWSVKRDGVEQPLRQQSFHVLLFLLARRSELVHKEELVASFWSDAAVTNNALVQCIADIRRALGDDPRNPRFIKTVPRAGYRFIAEVDEVWPERPVADPAGLHSAGLTDTVGAAGEGAGQGPGGRPPAVRELWREHSDTGLAQVAVQIAETERPAIGVGDIRACRAGRICVWAPAPTCDEILTLRFPECRGRRRLR